LRPNGWLVGSLSLILLMAVAIQPEARTRESAATYGFPLSPDVPLDMGGCATVAAREEFEGADCLQSIRLELLEGAIDLDQALRRLEACAAKRSDLADLASRRALIRADLYRARLAFGGSLELAEQEDYTAVLEELGDGARKAASRSSIERLRGAGIEPSGFTRSNPSTTLDRLEREPVLRAAFRDAFGDPLADDLEAILARNQDGAPAAVVLGSTTILPNLPPPSTVAAPAPPAATSATTDPSQPLIVPTLAYEARIASDLRGLEVARLRYLESAAAVHQRTGSIRRFVAYFRSRDREEAATQELLADSEHDRALMATRLATLETRLGVDPLLRRMAGESAGIATEVNRGCQAQALTRQRWIRRGAGVLTGLVGAAGVVIVAGATGTLIGGVTIAAALEATVGAYLVARSEQVGAPIVASAERTASLPRVPEEEERFWRPDAESDPRDEGRAGTGADEFEQWFEDLGQAQERADHAGVDIEEDDGQSTEQGPREHMLPPVLPIDVPEELRELPPLLDNQRIRELRSASLPEIQERLDEFLALTDPSAWAPSDELEETTQVISIEQMIAEATASLALWEKRRQLSDGFGSFFIQAELEALPASRQREVLLRAMGRYTHDREIFAGSADVADLRRRVAARLVSHCRAGEETGDLVLTACTEETALSILLVAALRDAGVDVPFGSVLGVQAFGNRFEAVLFSEEEKEVYSLTRGEPQEGVVAPIYHPAVFYYSYLVAHGVVPEIDVDEHLLVALPDRPMPVEELTAACSDQKSGSVIGRAVEWLGSMVGVRRVKDECGEGGAQRGGGGDGGVNVDLSIPTPRNPLRGGGDGGGGGSGGGGGGGGGTNPLAGAAPRDASASGGSLSSDGQSGGGGDDGQANGSASAQQNGDGQGGGGAGAGQGAAGADADAAGGDAADGSATADGNASPDGGADSAQAGSGSGDSGSSGPSETTGSGGSGGYGVGNATLPPGPDLAAIGDETVRMSARYERAGDLGVMPWRLRSDEGMMTGSSTRVLYADNDRALERFGQHDLFITLAPAEVEAQRRMLEADSYPIYQAETRCEAPNLPPRRVFRRAAATEVGFRYIYCDQDEAMVIFRDRSDARSYAALNAPDRPLYLSRLAVQRLESFESSVELQRVRRFLRDPNMLREFSKDELYAMVKAAADLLVFQNALESALVQSMNELGNTSIRGYYYDMHRQVLQAPLFIEMAEGVYRLNQRLASDPLQSLAWADAQPPLARREFFDLYHVLGKMMEWPERWTTMQQRYGSNPGDPPATDPDAPSLDFLQILSDPTRVQVDWEGEKTSDPSIRDRQLQDGIVRTPEERAEPTLSDLIEMQDEIEHQRGGTGGLGRAGDGVSIGPERGQKPLQMLHIRIAPDTGDPDREQLPEDNQVRPGGTEGRERKQTEESASRQEPILWVSPHTFIDGVLSTWDGGDLEPRGADRIPPVLRFNEELRDVFRRDLRSTGVYENRLRTAMEVFTAHGWLRFGEVREAMGGDWTLVRARDTGRFSAAYSGNAPINDQGQIQIPNFFTEDGVILPRDLFEPVREHYTNSILGIFDLVNEDRVPPAVPLSSAPVEPGDRGRQARENLLRSLETVQAQAAER
jgi:hypothetical protein